MLNMLNKADILVVVQDEKKWNSFYQEYISSRSWGETAEVGEKRGGTRERADAHI